MLRKIFMRTLAAFVLFTSLNASAYEFDFAKPKPSEEQLPVFYVTTILPFFNKGTMLNFTGEKGIQLRAYQFLSGKNAIVIVPGWGEPARKYAEVVYDLTQSGHSVYVYDHRGQGESQRIIDCPCSYVESYSYYVKDLANFITNVVKPEGFDKVFILAHSMGGGIAAKTLQAYPDLVDGAILSSPMLHIQTDPYAEVVAQTLTRSMVLIGKGKERRLFDKDGVDDFATNVVTHSKVRWTLSKALMTTMPSLRTGWATNRWLNEMFEMTNNIRATAYNKMQTPILLLQSEEDHHVVNPTLAKLCLKWTNCILKPIPNSKHEILQESDAARNEAMNAILDFTR